MTSLRFPIAAVFLALTGHVFAQEILRSEDQQAYDLWAGGFSWFQTGEKLSQAAQQPLALASYRAAHEKFVTLQLKFPDYQPKLVTFRLAKIIEAIERAETRLAESEHDIVMLFADIIEVVELGKAQRYYQNKNAESLQTMQQAQILIEELIAENPTVFTVALADQVSRIESHLEWSAQQLARESSSKSYASYLASPNVLLMVGTTEFIKETDLPADPDTPISAALFPAVE